jgi:hypothetical protein
MEAFSSRSILFSSAYPCSCSDLAISERVVTYGRPVQTIERQSFNLSLLRISSDAATETINKDNTTNNDCTVSMA